MLCHILGKLVAISHISRKLYSSCPILRVIEVKLSSMPDLTSSVEQEKLMMSRHFASGELVGRY